LKITLLTGPAGVGKDTFAREIIEGEKYTAAIAFADYLKHTAHALGWDGMKDDKGRTFLQELGDVVRRYDPEFWIKYVIMQIVENPLIEHWVITDARFDNEVTYLRDSFPDAEVEVVLLKRDYVSPLTEEQQKHSTERGIDIRLVDTVVDLTEE